MKVKGLDLSLTGIEDALSRYPQIIDWIIGPTFGTYKGDPEACPCISCCEIRARRYRTIEALAEALFGWLP